MKSELNSIKVKNTFPCLMEYKLQGEVSVGIYLVSEISKERYSVCLLWLNDKDLNEIGETYEKDDLNLKEWFFLPIGTEVKIINQ